MKTWYAYDGLGSVLGEVNATTGDLAKARVYDVYGTVRAEDTATSQSAHKYVGAMGHPSEYETGLIYMRARYMDAETGRFISEDPAGQGRNWFTYCSNDPVNAVDESGRAERPLSANAKKLGDTGWYYLLDKWYSAGPGGAQLRDVVIWDQRGKYVGEWVLGEGRWKHGPNRSMRQEVFDAIGDVERANGIGISSLDTYMRSDPLDFIAIMLDAGGMHEDANKIDKINQYL